MIDLGDVFQVAVAIRDADGNLTDPATATLTITLPDGTTDTPAVPLPPTDTGIVRVDYVTDQFGLFRWRLTTTGPVTAHADAFNVADPSWLALLGLAEVKNHLRYAPGDTSDDEDLRGFILSASRVVEDVVGAVARRTVVETCSGGSGYLRVTTVPLLTVIQILADGTLVDPGDYTASESGLIAHRWGCWPAGLRNVEVTYEAGRVVAQPNLIDATKELIRVNWRPRQGGNYSAFDGGESDDFGVSRAAEGSLQGELRLGFFVPNTVTQRLKPDQRGPVVM